MPLFFASWLLMNIKQSLYKTNFNVTIMIYVALLVSLYFVLKVSHACHEVDVTLWKAALTVNGRYRHPHRFWGSCWERWKTTFIPSNKRGGSKMREGYSESSVCISATLHADQELGTEVLVFHDILQCHALEYPTAVDQKYELLAYVCSNVWELAIRPCTLN